MKTRNTIDLSKITPDVAIANICNIKELQSELNLIALFILVYDHFVDKMQKQIKSFLCPETGFENGVISTKISQEYKDKILNRAIDDKGDKDAIFSCFLWLIDTQCFKQKDYQDFMKIRRRRNEFAHESFEAILKGLDEEDVHLFSLLENQYFQFDHWWIQEIEIPTEPEENMPGPGETREGFSIDSLYLSVLIKNAVLGEKSDYKDIAKEVEKEQK